MSDQKNPALTAPQSSAASQQQVQKMVAELKVSGNLMTLDSGLFCIFNAPGSALPDPATGLPGVRVSLPPGPVFRPEAVTISSFRDDGWLGGWDGAALVRVTGGPAQILVTIYQAPNSAAEAPRLQILRLAEASALPPGGAARPPQAPPPAALPQAAAATPGPDIKPAAIAGAQAGPVRATAAAHAGQNTPAGAAGETQAPVADPEIVAHIQGRGDVLGRLDSWMGEQGSKQWIEGFAVSPKQEFDGTTLGPADIEYQAVLGRGWLSPWAEGGQFCGSRAMSLPILGLRLRLRGEAAERFDCAVSASFVDGTKVGPLDNGEPCQAASMAPLEAFKITLTDRLAPAKPAVNVEVKAEGRPAKGKVVAAAPAKGKGAAAKPATKVAAKVSPKPVARGAAKKVPPPGKKPTRGKK